MRYFVMEQIIEMPRQPQGDVRKISDLEHLQGIDYSAQNGLISERLKLLMELYMPEYEFYPVAYVNTEKKAQVIFWKFHPPVYENCRSAYRSNGVVNLISITDPSAPFIFTTRSPRGVRSIVVHMAVAESILRRNILGLKLTRLYDYDSQ